jgi:hypothetical protein
MLSLTSQEWKFLGMKRKKIFLSTYLHWLKSNVPKTAYGRDAALRLGEYYY